MDFFVGRHAYPGRAWVESMPRRQGHLVVPGQRLGTLPVADSGAGHDRPHHVLGGQEDLGHSSAGAGDGRRVGVHRATLLCRVTPSNGDETTTRPSAWRERVRAAVRWGRHARVDARHWVGGRRDPLVPPTRMMFDGPVDRELFIQNGDAYFRFFVDLLALEPDDVVLDVGCGIGRKTRPLTRYLTGEHSYDGIDPTRKGVDWCRRHITRRFPNFLFHHVDVFNQHYNPTGRVRAAELVFPFDDATFEVAILGSVFTHMLAEEVDHYLSELARVLKPGGRALISYFLLNDESERLLAEGRATFDFPYRRGRCATGSENDPEGRVAYDETAVREMYERHGFVIDEPIRYGNWAGRSFDYDFQDIVVAHTVTSARAR